MEYKHVSVMLKEVLDSIGLKEGDRVVDCTLGGAGYTKEFSKMVGLSGEVLAFDLDKMAIENAKKVFEKENIKNVRLVNAGFDTLEENIEADDKGFDAVVMDLGLSSAQLDDERRGFSFLRDAPLDMKMGSDGSDDTTRYIVNSYKVDRLAEILKDYGEERFAKRIAERIVKKRQETEIKTTFELINIIKNSFPKGYIQKSKIHFATKTFQALRIESNEELKRLERVLPQALKILKTGGRLAIVSFHSLEDRVVKQFYKKESKDCLCPPEIPVCRCDHKAKIKIITKKPIEASTEEVKENPRSRSAKLRVAEKL